MPSTPKARRKTRELLVQALYQWQMASQSIGSIEAQFCTDNDMEKVDVEYFSDLLHKIAAEAGDFDQTFEPLLIDRRLDELDFVSRAILLVATCEFRYRIDVPYKVVINEGIDLAKKFGPTDSQKFVNGVLDKLALRLRAVEIKSGSGNRTSSQQ